MRDSAGSAGTDLCFGDGRREGPAEEREEPLDALRPREEQRTVDEHSRLRNRRRSSTDSGGRRRRRLRRRC